MKKRLTPVSRRMFLRGTGGLALAIPFLPSLMSPQSLRAQDEKAPLRFFCVASQFGRDVDAWVHHKALQPGQGKPHKMGKLTDIAGDISPIFGPTWDTALRQKVAIASGLDIMGWTNGHSETIVLTGGSSGQDNLNAFGESVDNVLANSSAFYPSTPMLDVLRAGPVKGSRLSVTSRFAHCQILPAMSTTTQMYANLFDPENLAMNAQRHKRLERATNRVYNHYRDTASNRRISSNDRQRLDHYMDIVSDIERKIGQIPNISCQTFDPSVLTPDPDSSEQLHDIFFDMEIAALMCGITKIVTHSIYHVQSEINQIGGPDFHGAAHNHSNTFSQGRRFVDYNRWTMDRVASLLQKLDGIQDVDGRTLLDNTLFLYSSSDATGSHSHYDMPVVLAGAADKLLTNRYVDYRHHTARLGGGSSVMLGRPYNNLLVSILRAFGLEQKEYEVPGHLGFGEYSRGYAQFESHYRDMATGAARHEHLPELFNL